MLFLPVVLGNMALGCKSFRVRNYSRRGADSSILYPRLLGQETGRKMWIKWYSFTLSGEQPDTVTYIKSEHSQEAQRKH